MNRWIRRFLFGQQKIKLKTETNNINQKLKKSLDKKFKKTIKNVSKSKLKKQN